MNNVQLVGRITKDIELRYTASQTAVTRFTVAVDRRKRDTGADFVRCSAFGKTAELMAQYVHKGDRIGVVGHIKTGSYERDGQKVYTVDVIAESVEFLEPKHATEPSQNNGGAYGGVYDDDIGF